MTVPLRSGDPIVIEVALAGRAYDIVIGRGLLAGLGQRVAALRPGARVAIVTDEIVAKQHLAQAEATFAQAGIETSRIVIAAGEPSKSYAVFERVCEDIIAARIERGDLVVALGGGVIGDLAGFAASAVRRGVDYVQVPTTLLSQVDSSVGGKTAINSRHGKNLVGAFHQPILVVADTALLDTLPPRIMRAGYAEVAKYGLIGDADFFAWLEANWRDVFAGTAAREHAIAVSCRMKAQIVARDERETGDRAISAIPSATPWKRRPGSPTGSIMARRSPSAWCSRSPSRRDADCVRRPMPSGWCGILQPSGCRRGSPKSRANGPMRTV
jgi:3-dehydroquinate synthetase